MNDAEQRALRKLAARSPEAIARELSPCRPQSDPEGKEGHCGYCANCERAKRIAATIKWDRVARDLLNHAEARQ